MSDYARNALLLMSTPFRNRRVTRSKAAAAADGSHGKAVNRKTSRTTKTSKTSKPSNATKVREGRNGSTQQPRLMDPSSASKNMVDGKEDRFISLSQNQIPMSQLTMSTNGDGTTTQCYQRQDTNAVNLNGRGQQDHRYQGYQDDAFAVHRQQGNPESNYQQVQQQHGAVGRSTNQSHLSNFTTPRRSGNRSSLLSRARPSLGSTGQGITFSQPVAQPLLSQQQSQQSTYSETQDTYSQSLVHHSQHAGYHPTGPVEHGHPSLLPRRDSYNDPMLPPSRNYPSRAGFSTTAPYHSQYHNDPSNAALVVHHPDHSNQMPSQTVISESQRPSRKRTWMAACMDVISTPYRKRRQAMMQRANTTTTSTAITPHASSNNMMLDGDMNNQGNDDIHLTHSNSKQLVVHANADATNQKNKGVITVTQDGSDDETVEFTNEQEQKKSIPTKASSSSSAASSTSSTTVSTPSMKLGPSKNEAQISYSSLKEAQALLEQTTKSHDESKQDISNMLQQMKDESSKFDQKKKDMELAFTSMKKEQEESFEKKKSEVELAYANMKQQQQTLEEKIRVFDTKVQDVQDQMVSNVDERLNMMKESINQHCESLKTNLPENIKSVLMKDMKEEMADVVRRHIRSIDQKSTHVSERLLSDLSSKLEALLTDRMNDMMDDLETKAQEQTKKDALSILEQAKAKVDDMIVSHKNSLALPDFSIGSSSSNNEQSLIVHKEKGTTSPVAGLKRFSPIAPRPKTIIPPSTMKTPLPTSKSPTVPRLTKPVIPSSIMKTPLPTSKSAYENLAIVLCEEGNTISTTNTTFKGMVTRSRTKKPSIATPSSHLPVTPISCTLPKQQSRRRTRSVPRESKTSCETAIIQTKTTPGVLPNKEKNGQRMPLRIMSPNLVNTTKPMGVPKANTGSTGSCRKAIIQKKKKKMISVTVGENLKETKDLPVLTPTSKTPPYENKHTEGNNSTHGTKQRRRRKKFGSRTRVIETYTDSLFVTDVQKQTEAKIAQEDSFMFQTPNLPTKYTSKKKDAPSIPTLDRMSPLNKPGYHLEPRPTDLFKDPFHFS